MDEAHERGSRSMTRTNENVAGRYKREQEVGDLFFFLRCRRWSASNGAGWVWTPEAGS
jgi:hypothetical protein